MDCCYGIHFKLFFWSHNHRHILCVIISLCFCNHFLCDFLTGILSIFLFTLKILLYMLFVFLYAAWVKAPKPTLWDSIVYFDLDLCCLKIRPIFFRSWQYVCTLSWWKTKLFLWMSGWGPRGSWRSAMEEVSVRTGKVIFRTVYLTFEKNAADWHFN